MNSANATIEDLQWRLLEVGRQLTTAKRERDQACTERDAAREEADEWKRKHDELYDLLHDNPE